MHFPLVSAASPIETLKGIAVWWSDVNGYGFIRPGDDSNGYFAEHREVERPTAPNAGQRVEFANIQDPFGPTAGNVGPSTLLMP